MDSLGVVDLVLHILSIRRPAGRSVLKEPVGQCHARDIEEVGIVAALHNAVIQFVQLLSMG